MIAKTQWFQKAFGGGVLERWGIAAISRVQLAFLSAHKDRQAVRLVKKVRGERRSLLMADEYYTILSAARAQAKRPGAMAEVGVYQGCSARLICEVKGDAPLHLFDTFEGLPGATASDRKIHRPNQYACSLESVQGYLRGFPNLCFHKGLFPDSAVGVPEQQYSFAHFDVDLYESTLGCLKYFYPRMISGGVIVSHDYSLLTGVKAAFDEFLADKPEAAIELPTTQCLLVKS